MIDIKAKLDHLRLQTSETEVLEFKEAKNTYDFNKLGKYFSALSNEANLLGKEDAWLVFGIKDKDKSIVDTQSRADDWSIGICEQATISDLSEEAISKSRELYAVKNSDLLEEIEQWDDMTFLNKAKICIKGRITCTAILLLGKPESESLINPAVAKISWILKDRDNIEKDYAHFCCPFLLSIEKVHKKIRNLKYRYLPGGSLFPDEVDSYDPYIIREALNNCIAHQDYALGGKINVIENEDSLLIFVNMGSFIPQTIENVINYIISGSKKPMGQLVRKPSLS